MARVNREKLAKAATLAKIWQMMSYQNSPVGCRSCNWSEQDKWSDEGIGKCDFLKSVLFPVREDGICRHHSSFDK